MTPDPVLPSPAMPPGGKRDGAGRPARLPDEKKINRAIPMTDGEWARVKALAADEDKPAATYVRDLLLGIADGRAKIVPVELAE